MGNRSRLLRSILVLTFAVLMFGAGAPHAFGRPTEGNVSESRRSSVIVGVRRAGDMAAIRSQLEARGGLIKKKYRWNAYLVSAPAGMASTTFSKEVRAIRGVRYAEGNATMWAVGLPSVRSAATANDPLFPQQWGTKAIGAPAAWDSSLATGVPVAILDTGIDWTHRDLAGADIVRFKNYVTPGAAPLDDNDHGTHVSGIIAAVRNNSIDISGAAPKSTLYACKVLDSAGAGDIATIADAIRDIADNTPCKIFSMSFGAIGTGLTNAQSVAMRDACAYAQSKGVLLIAAAGNDGVKESFYPAALPGVVGVGAVQQTPLSLAYFSNYGLGIVDIVAPGANILSTVRNNLTAAWDGTSMATPYVSASAALVWARYPSLNATDVIGLLEKTAQDLGAVGLDQYYGYGMVRPDLAIAYPPITTVRVTPASADGSNGWYVTTPTVALASDYPSATVFYRWDSASYAAYAAPIVVPAGTHTLWYYSVGANGRTGAATSRTFKVDFGLPVTTLSGVPASGTAPPPVLLYLTSSDPADNIGHIFYALDGSMPTTYTTAIPVVTVGPHEIAYWALDTAGNSEAPQVATFTVTPGSVVPTATSITIRSTPASVPLPRAFALSGTLTPGHIGDPVTVQVRKPGNAMWSYSSTRLTYQTAGTGASWWYRYTPRLRGVYYFRAKFGGDVIRLASTSGTLGVRVR